MVAATVKKTTTPAKKAEHPTVSNPYFSYFILFADLFLIFDLVWGHDQG